MLRTVSGFDIALQLGNMLTLEEDGAGCSGESTIIQIKFFLKIIIMC